MYKNKIVQEDMQLMLQTCKNYERLKNKSILITGATGMLASYYMYFLMYLNDTQSYNIKIYALVRNKEKLNKMVCLEERQDVIPVVEDVTSPLNIDKDLDYIVHMASSANPKNIVSNPVEIIEANVTGTLNVLKLAREKNAEVVFTSTREIYGKMPEDKEEIFETDMGILDCTELRSCYPESKRIAENLIINYNYEYKVPYKIARLAHAYGPGMIIHNDGRIMSDLISNVVTNTNIVLKSAGSALRAFCYLTDAVNALIMITVDENKNEIYNISNELEEISIKNLAILLTELFKEKELTVEFHLEENKNQYVKFARTKLNNDKLFSIGWRPAVSLESGLKKTVEYFEQIEK